MSRCLACVFLLSLAAPLPVVAGDSAAISRGQEAAPLIAAAAKGAVRLIYLEEPPVIDNAALQKPPTSTDHPPNRPVIVLAGTCGWENPDAALGKTRTAFSATPVWLLEPANPDCEPAAIKAAFEAASKAPERERLALLMNSGLRLSQAEAAPEKPVEHVAEGDLFSGKLVISSLPSGTSLGGGVPMLISASAPDTITAAPDEGVSAPGAPQPAVRANASGRAGAPKPAVVVGELATLLAADKRSATGAPRDVRDRIREIDPEFFMTLLELGNFDPNEGQYIAAIQTELLGMSCYTGNVDGSWGPGSSGAVGRYFSQLGESQQAETPGLALYREIAVHPSVTCPAPVQTVRTERASTATPDRRRPNSTPRNPSGRRPDSGAAPVEPRVSTAARSQTPTQPQSTAATNSAPKIDKALVGLGSGVIK
ncbi:MAG: hypothetical protein DI616_01960 [Paracoccus denitrificans]|uniref:Uncharacterized protein n=1 Tax=Paracoccus denitrificans TaxID=266 RepID=A0A533IF60_PARDE|nr:MAG: hypothetical protein DI616_01960 [Paracoccus denitrificans]